MVKLTYDKQANKIKTFTSEGDINLFTGVSLDPSIEYEMVSTEIFMNLRYRFSNYPYFWHWDNGVEITPEEWVSCVKTLLEELEIEVKHKNNTSNISFYILAKLLGDPSSFFGIPQDICLALECKLEAYEYSNTKDNHTLTGLEVL